MSFKEEALALLTEKAAAMLGVDQSQVSPDTRFKEDLHCKSADIVRITAELEDEYEVEVPFMAFNRCVTLEDAANYVCKLMGMA